MVMLPLKILKGSLDGKVLPAGWDYPGLTCPAFASILFDIKQFCYSTVREGAVAETDVVNVALKISIVEVLHQPERRAAVSDWSVS